MSAGGSGAGERVQPSQARETENRGWHRAAGLTIAVALRALAGMLCASRPKTDHWRQAECLSTCSRPRVLTEGHPDKLCEPVSDAVLDAIIAETNLSSGPARP